MALSVWASNRVWSPAARRAIGRVRVAVAVAGRRAEAPVGEDERIGVARGLAALDEDAFEAASVEVARVGEGGEDAAAAKATTAAVVTVRFMVFSFGLRSHQRAAIPAPIAVWGRLRTTRRSLQHPVAHHLESRGVRIRSRDHHRALEGAHERLGGLGRRTRELEDLRPCALPRGPHEPRSLASKKWRISSRMGLGSVPYSAASIPHRHMRSSRSTSS